MPIIYKNRSAYYQTQEGYNEVYLGTIDEVKNSSPSFVEGGYLSDFSRINFSSWEEYGEWLLCREMGGC